MSQLLTFTDEKLDEYLSIWNKLIDRGRKKELEITLVMDFVTWPCYQGRYTLIFGEERRELTQMQALRIHWWLEYINKPV